MKKNTFILITVTVACLALLLGTNTFLARYIFLNFPDVNDYKKLPFRTIHRDTAKSFHFIENRNFNIATVLPIYYSNGYVNDLDSFLMRTQTNAFIIIRNDTVLFEKYYHGYTRNTLCKTFSASKNVLSALIGIAIDEGYIQSVNDPVIKYIPELKDKRLSQVTIQNCLSLTSGIKADMGEVFPWNDKVRIYYSADIRSLLTGVRYETEAGKNFHIEEVTPVLLGFVLERATGTSVSEYLEKKIWKKLGMEQDALWVIDSRKNGFEAVNSGLTAIPLDMAKFGRLYLQRGKWGDETILSDDWIRQSTVPDTISLSFWRNITAYNGRDVYFNDMWWGLQGTDTTYEYSANGHFGQRIYLIPSKNLQILRFGSKSGKTDWTNFISNLSNKL